MMSKYLCQSCILNISGLCDKHGIKDLKSKKIKECESFKNGGIDLMQKRICPNCFTRWYSSDSSSIWLCDNCKHDIPVPKDEGVESKMLKNKRGENKWIMIIKYLLKK